MSPSLCIPKYRTRPKTQPVEVAPGSPGHLPGASLAQAPNGWVGSSVTGGIHDTTEGRQLDNCHYRTLSSGMLETSGNNSRAQMVFQQNLPCLHFWSLLHIKLKTLYIFLEVSQALMAAMLSSHLSLESSDLTLAAKSCTSKTPQALPICISITSQQNTMKYTK